MSDMSTPAGTVHGGMLATLDDATMGAAIRSDVEGETSVTSQLTLTKSKPRQAQSAHRHGLTRFVMGGGPGMTETDHHGGC